MTGTQEAPNELQLLQQAIMEFAAARPKEQIFLGSIAVEVAFDDVATGHFAEAISGLIIHLDETHPAADETERAIRDTVFMNTGNIRTALYYSHAKAKQKPRATYLETASI